MFLFICNYKLTQYLTIINWFKKITIKSLKLNLFNKMLGLAQDQLNENYNQYKTVLVLRTFSIERIRCIHRKNVLHVMIMQGGFTSN